MYHNLDMKAGVTLHYVDCGIDKGDIISQKSCNIIIGTLASKLEEKLLDTLAVPMLIEFISNLELGRKIKVSSQPKESPTVYAKRISNNEYLDIVSSLLSVEHFWHMLNLEHLKDGARPRICRAPNLRLRTTMMYVW